MNVESRMVRAAVALFLVGCAEEEAPRDRRAEADRRQEAIAEAIAGAEPRSSSERPRTSRNPYGRAGEPAPPLDVETWLQGHGAYAESERTLLVLCEIWAPACKTELPKLSARAAELERAGVHVVVLTRVTKSATPEKVGAFLKENAIGFPVGKERDGGVSKLLGLQMVGTAVVVRDAKIEWVGLVEHVAEAVLGPGALDDGRAR